VDIQRKVVFYDCCPQSPYPTLLYSISFQRSSNYYTFKLVLLAPGGKVILTHPCMVSIQNH
jgi:hypothetical protein